MTVGNIDALHEWGERDNPGYRLWKFVSDWIATELGSRGWAAPSVPLLPSDGSPSEIRIVQVPGTMINVIYEHNHDSGQVDLLYVGL